MAEHLRVRGLLTVISEPERLERRSTSSYALAFAKLALLSRLLHSATRLVRLDTYYFAFS